jgi:ammonium transporter Rh
MFGAYFGLAASYILGKPSKGTETEVNHVSDILSLVGTLFLWIYWPSFNGGEQVMNSDQQQRAVIHTILSLCAATVGTFAASSFLNPSHKFRPVDIQNATLAGGVAIGATCNLTMGPADPLIIGLLAGILSTIGFNRIQPIVESYGIHDTCGINNLHGMPSILGGLASVFICAYKGPRGSDMPAVFTHTGQGGIQLAAIIVTLVICVSSGLFTGLLMRKYGSVSSTEDFTDYPYWEVEAWEEGGHHVQKEKRPSSADVEQGMAMGSVHSKYDKLPDSAEGANLEGDIHVEHIKL